MRLTKDDIGKKVRLPAWDIFLELWAISPDTNDAWVNGSILYNRQDWIIEQPKKLPSEFVYEQIKYQAICVPNVNTPKEESAHYANLRIDALVKFLDETLGMK